MTDFDRQRLRVEALEKPLRRERRTHLIWWDEEEESESDVRLRVERMIAQGKARILTTASSTFRGGAEPACCRPCYVPVRGRRDSLFVSPFKEVTKAPCKFHLLQGACSSPVVCRSPLFLPCSLQGYRAATAAA
jgi:hypothetical protein